MYHQELQSWWTGSWTVPRIHIISPGELRKINMKCEIILKWRWNDFCWSGHHHLPRHLLWCLRHCQTVRRRETKYFGPLLHRSGKVSLQNIMLISDWLTHNNINLWLVDRLWLLDLSPWLIHSTLSGGDWWWWVEKRRKCTSKSTILISHWPIVNYWVVIGQLFQGHNGLLGQDNEGWRDERILQGKLHERVEINWLCSGSGWVWWVHCHLESKPVRESDEEQLSIMKRVNLKLRMHFTQLAFIL